MTMRENFVYMMTHEVSDSAFPPYHKIVQRYECVDRPARKCEIDIVGELGTQRDFLHGHVFHRCIENVC